MIEPQRGSVMQPKGAEPWRGSLGFRKPAISAALNRNAVPPCSPRVPSLGEAPLGFAGPTAPIPFPDRHAVPSGTEAWAQGRSGDGTPVGFVIGDRGWCGVPRRALAIARHSWAV
jgi:hypothetical protein